MEKNSDQGGKAEHTTNIGRPSQHHKKIGRHPHEKEAATPYPCEDLRKAAEAHQEDTWPD